MTNHVRKIELRPSAPVRTLHRHSGFKAVSVSVGLDGTAIRLLVRDDAADPLFATTENPGFALFPETQTDKEYAAILSVSGASRSEEIALAGLTATFPQIEMLPNGEILVVAPRCERFQDGGHELNAQVYDRTGTLRREFLLGDGIEHVQADARGNIWVGYFDEGVYGNFGWGGAEGPTPLGAAGLSCFSAEGERLWDFSPPEGFDYISDCYALNVSRHGAWACYYTGFPFVFIDANWQMRCWENEFVGSSAFAVAEERILLYGGYRDERTRCLLLRLSDKSADLIAHVSLALPHTVNLAQSRVIGRDCELHVFSGDDWYRFSIESLTE